MAQTPREAQYLIDQIEQELMDWNRNFNIVHQENKTQVQRVDNVVNDFKDEVMLVRNQVDDATHRLDEVREQSINVKHTAAATEDQATSTRQHTEQIFQLCINASSVWRDALQRAARLVSQCQAERIRAASSVDAAQSKVSLAASQLASAQSAYDRCRSSYTTNSKGERIEPSCGSYASGVSTAQSHLATARSYLTQCEQELQLAVNRLNDALNKHRRCEHGIEKTEEALHYAQQARDRANQASQSAHEATQWAEEAWQQAESGVKLAEDMNDQHQNAAQQTTFAEDEVFEIVQRQHEFENSLEEYQSRQWRAREELSDAFDALRQINSKEGL